MTHWGLGRHREKEAAKRSAIYSWLALSALGAALVGAAAWRRKGARPQEQEAARTEESATAKMPPMTPAPTAESAPDFGAQTEPRRPKSRARKTAAAAKRTETAQQDQEQSDPETLYGGGEIGEVAGDTQRFGEVSAIMDQEEATPDFAQQR
ncbi:MAG TPA: hypothetical protein VFB21_18110 [Chthonomonadaceae bacterium]|nr:hypothetical protein [Chthonomonadaceae bacterium]